MLHVTVLTDAVTWLASEGACDRKKSEDSNKGRGFLGPSSYSKPGSCFTQKQLRGCLRHRLWRDTGLFISLPQVFSNQKNTITGL